MEQIKKHSLYYFSLFLVFSIGIALFFQMSQDRQAQLTILTILTLFYILYGILHHLVNHDLNIKIVVEYLLIGGVGVSLVLLFFKVI